MTEFQIVTAVMNLVTSSEGVTNTSLSPDQVAEEVDTLRVRMMGDMDKVSLFRRPYLGFTQTIKSLAVKKDGTQLYIDIPRLVMRRDNTPAYVYIGGTDDKSPYRVLVGDIQNAKYDHLIGKMPIANYLEGRVEIHNATPNVLKLVCVFEDPSALESLGVWDSEVDQYPMPAGSIDELIGKTANSYVNTMYRIPAQANTQSDRPITAPPNARR
jgi:hypothetical protein